MNIHDITTVVLIFVVSGVALGIGAQIMDSIYPSITSESGQYAINNTTLALSRVASWLPIIGIVIASAIIIGVLVSSLMPRQSA